MANIFDVSQQALVEKTKEELKKLEEIKPPQWAAFVKTGVHKERTPSEEDWWYMRAASVLRVVAMTGPIGVAKLRTRYGGKKDRGVKPSAFRVASGNILRKILQQLDKAGLTKQVEIGVHKGRVITPAGSKLLSLAAGQLPKPEKPKEPKKEAKPKEEKKPEAADKPKAEPKEEKKPAQAEPAAKEPKEDKAAQEAKKE